MYHLIGIVIVLVCWVAFLMLAPGLQMILHVDSSTPKETRRKLWVIGRAIDTALVVSLVYFVYALYKVISSIWFGN